MTRITRRSFSKMAGALGATAAMSLAGYPRMAAAASPRVVVVGGGFGGATLARYLHGFDSNIKMTLIEQSKSFVTCPFSNTVIAGMNKIDRVTHGYDGLRGLGIDVVHDTATGIDPAKKTVSLKGGGTLGYDRLVLSPGIAFKWDAIEGYDEKASGSLPHAWKAGPQTLLLRKQLEAMPDGGVFIISPPVNPFRCPPGPAERVSLVASYFKTHKPRSKILVLDPKEKFSKQGLFTEGWKQLYPGMIDYMNLSNDGRVLRVDAKGMTLHTDFAEHKGDVINFIPPQKAGAIAETAGLTNDSGWCPVDQRTFESTVHKGIHVIGDTSIASPMPKSGFAANTQAKVCAAALAAMLKGEDPGTPKFVNTCYSLVAPDYGISVAMVYGFDKGKIVKIKGSGGLSPSGAPAAVRKREADYARGWYDSITREMFA